MLNFLLLLAAFIYLLTRINSLEKRLDGGQLPKPVPPPAPSPVLAPQVVAPPPPPQKTDRELEFKFGSKAFTVVGALAVILGIGFFLRYAFQIGLITETARVVMGALAGIVMLGVGYYLSRKYAQYGQIVAGAGLGVLYLSTYAAFDFYSLITHPTALILMLIITVVGVVMSLVMNAMWLVIFAALGGFLTPALLQTISGSPHTLFSYLIVLNIGLLAIAYHKSWRPLIFGSFAATQLLYLSWFFQSYSRDLWLTALLYSAIFFIIYLAVSLIQHGRKIVPDDGYDLTLVSVNPLIFFLWSYTIVDPLYHDWMGLYTLGLALLYGILAYVVNSGDQARQIFRRFLAGVAIILLTVAVPIQFEQFKITMVWAVEAAVVGWIALKMRSETLKLFSFAVFVLSFIRFLTLDSFFTQVDTAWVNERFFTGLILTTALLIGYAFHRHYLLSGLAYLTLGFALSLEVWEFQNHLWLPVIWSALAAVAGIASLYLRDAPLRVLAYAGFGFAILRIIFTQHFVKIATHAPFWNERVGVSIFLIVALGLFLFWMMKFEDEQIKEEKRSMGQVGLFILNGFILWLLSVEVLDYFNKQISLVDKSKRQEIATLRNVKRASLSVAWTLYAVVVLIVGIMRKFASARLFSILLFAVVVAKVFLYDTANLNNFWRFVSFITLGVILLVSGYLYHRFKERITQFIKADEVARY